MDENHTVDSRNEQLAFVSGTVIAGGALLVQVWPFIRQMQTGVNVRLVGLHPTHIAPPAVVWHRVGSLVVALGIGMLLFGAIHVIARGLSLADFMSSERTDPRPDSADRIARRAYLVIQVYWMTIALSLLLAALSFPVLLVFTRLFHFTASWAINTTTILGGITFAAINFIRRKRGKPGLFRYVTRRVGWTNVSIAIGAMFVLWVGTIELAYAVDLNVSQSVVKRSQPDPIVISVTLGGGTSDPRDARLSLFCNLKPVSTALRLRQVGRGSYAAFLPVSHLPEGDYSLRLTYPHTHISVDPPAFSQTVVRRALFIVVP